METAEPIVSFQGELGAFSEMAARSYFNEHVKVRPQPDFSALFEAVASGSATHGMVPIENTLMGSIHENYDQLLKHNLHIIGELKLRIIHNLIVNPGVQLEDIQRIYSQAPALAQCTDFIHSLPNARPVAAPDTAGAVKDLKESGARDAAAIASAQAAIDYNLEILKNGVENDHENYTRFLVVAKDPVSPGDPAKTSVVFALKNAPGALYKSLGAFAERDINLLKIESHPLEGQPWEYAFYLDLEGHLGHPSCAEAIAALDSLATFTKILGSYPLGKAVEGTVRPKSPSS